MSTAALPVPSDEALEQSVALVARIRSEVERAGGDRQHDLVSHDRALQVRIGVVFAELQAELRAACEHAVGFGHPLQDKVIDQYAVLGRYDFITVVEAPDPETMAKVSIELGSRGTAPSSGARRSRAGAPSGCSPAR